jgi:hypothetical protein
VGPQLVAWLLWLVLRPGLARHHDDALLRDAPGRGHQPGHRGDHVGPILVGFGLAAASPPCHLRAGTLRLLRGGAEHHYFGLVSGVEMPTRRRRRAADWLDRRCGLPAPAGMPPLVSWFADRLDDLAGVPARDRDRALTFGDLWLGHTDERSTADADLLRRAAADPELRVIDLVLATTNLSQRRPYRLPFGPAEAGPPAGRQTFLFCEACLEAVLPQLVVVQMVKSRPARRPNTGARGTVTGVLRSLPTVGPAGRGHPDEHGHAGAAPRRPLYSIDTMRPGPRYGTWADRRGGASGSPDDRVRPLVL